MFRVGVWGLGIRVWDLSFKFSGLGLRMKEVEV